MGAKVSDVQDALLALADQWERANDYRPGSEQDIVRKTMIGAVRAVANDDFDTMQSLLAYRRETAPTPYVPTRAERGAAGYVPQVGDKVRPCAPWVFDYDWTKGEGCTEIVVTQVNERSIGAVRLDGRLARHHCTLTIPCGFVYLGPATASERKAAGLPEDAPTPSYPTDAAGRPLWVRVTGLNGYVAKPAILTIGRVYEVTGWGDFGSPAVTTDDGRCGWYLSRKGNAPDPDFHTYASWEPCAAPDAPTGTTADPLKSLLMAVREAVDGSLDMEELGIALAKYEKAGAS